MKKHSGQLLYSPSDLIHYLASPFTSWMDRYYLENRSLVTPDEPTEDEQLIARTGEHHERTILDEFKSSPQNLVEIIKDDPVAARTKTLSAISAKAPIIFQAALESEQFAGFSDFLIARCIRAVSGVGHKAGPLAKTVLRDPALLLLRDARRR